MSQQQHSIKIARKLRAHRIFGGIKPLALKARSLRSRIMPAPIPEILILPLLQHQGSPAAPIVNVGDQVLKYQLLAAAEGPPSVPVHAPTSGEITAITDSPIPGHGEQSGRCILLRADGEDNAIDLQPLPDHRALNHWQLLERVNSAGICGMGGAGFPTTEKLRASMERGIELLIINAVECEPHISADEALIRERAAAVVSGAEILQSICLANRCVIAIERDKHDAVKQLRDSLESSSVELLELPSKYPTGGEKQIIQAVTGLEVPHDALPMDIGVLVQNAGTAYAVHDAITEGKPCISRITTLTGAPLQTPKNFDALIGTPVSFLFALCGIEESLHTGSIMGGSLMGLDLVSTDVPLIKTSNCLIAKSRAEFPEPKPEQACIRCGYCATACPARLLPQQLYAYSCNQDLEQLEQLNLADCIECGACDYVCPSHIPLVQNFRASKQTLAIRGQHSQTSAQWRRRFQFHQYRLKKEADAAQENKSAHRTAPEADYEEGGFSRDKARQEITAAVERVATRRRNRITSSGESDQERH